MHQAARWHECMLKCASTTGKYCISLPCGSSYPLPQPHWSVEGSHTSGRRLVQGCTLSLPSLPLLLSPSVCPPPSCLCALPVPLSHCCLLFSLFVAPLCLCSWLYHLASLSRLVYLVPLLCVISTHHFTTGAVVARDHKQFCHDAMDWGHLETEGRPSA